LNAFHDPGKDLPLQEAPKKMVPEEQIIIRKYLLKVQQEMFG